MNKAKNAPNKVNQRSIMDNIERMRWAREEWEFKKAMTEWGYNPGKQSKALVHAIEKTPLASTKDMMYKKPAGPPWAPDESTLMD